MNPLSSPVFLPMIALIAGIMCADIGAGILSGTILTLTGLGIYLGFISQKRNPAKQYQLSRYHHVWVGVVFMGIGILTADLNRPYVPADSVIDKYTYMTGHVQDITSRTSGDRLTVEVESLTDSLGSRHDCPRFIVIVRTESAECSVDDVVLLPLSLQRIRNSENSFFGGYAETMARKGIYYTQTTPSDRISVLCHNTTLSGISVSMRDRAARFIENRHLERKTVNFLITVLLGDRAYLDEESHTLFADSGLAHILALSGMHIGIIAGIIFFLLFPLNFYGRYRMRLAIGLLALWCYTFITGMAPSTVRACIMVSFMTAGIFLERKGNNFNALCFAAFLILAINPLALWDIGFQLSFIGVGSLISFANHFNPIGMRRHPRLRNAAGLVLASLVTTLVSWALVAYYFGRFPLMFIIGNILVVPLLPFYMSGALIYFFFEAIGINIHFLEYMLDRGLGLLYDTIRTVSGDSAYVIDLSVGLPAVWLWLAGAVLLAVALNYPRFKRVRWVSAALCTGAILCVAFTRGASTDGFIICNTLRDVEFKVKKGNQEISMKSPVGSVTCHEIFGKTILTCDTDPAGMCEDSLVRKPDYLVMTRSCPSGISRLDSIFNPATFVIHPGVRKDREESLIAEADSIGVRIHSIRLDKALKVVIP